MTMLQVVLALFISISLFAINYYLLRIGLISGGNYVVAFVAVLTLGYAIANNNRLKKFNLLKGIVELREVKKQLKDIKKATILLVSLLASNSSFTSGSWKQRKGLNDKMEDALVKSGASTRQINKIMEMPRITEKAMRYGNDKLTKREKKLADELWSLEERTS